MPATAIFLSHPRARSLPLPLPPPILQENFFFDGDKQELESQRAVLRLRFYNVDEKAVITVKVRSPQGWGLDVV